MNIKLSPKYGVNPTMPVCFFCGKDTGEIALLGKIGGKGEDIEAPHRMILNYEPCDACKAMMKGNVAVIGVVEHPTQKGQPEIQKGLYPTGSWCLLKAEAISRIFNVPDDEIKKIVDCGKVLLENAVVESMIKQHDEVSKK